ncbi:hypothetical protein FBU59_003301, partial [Linderina macrospora]
IYINPLLASAQTQTPILTRKEIRQLFANFPDIISLSRELLSQLESRLGTASNDTWDPAAGLVGDIFVRIAPFLKMYSLYLRNFRSGLASISQWLSENREFAEFLQTANSAPECRGLSFQSYLLLPVQRIPRYKLLLDDLLRNTPPSHVDHENIKDALKTIEEVASFVNENIQEHEMTLGIIEIQRTLGLKESLLVPGRRLIKVGELTKICRKSHQQRQFYLFNDILLYSGSSNTLLDDQAGHRRVPLEDCKVMDVPDTADWTNQFTIISREKSFIVYTGTSSEKTAWIQALASAITERRAARETLQMDRSLRRRLMRARRSTMLHFPRVVENFDAPVWDPDESSEQCYICFREFSLFVRKHHCRACGKIVCHACSRKNIVFVERSSMQGKEGRGCDQCIARLFGRNALESPPGTVHKATSKSRHSLDPSALLQTLSALAGSSAPGTPRLEPRLEISEPFSRDVTEERPRLRNSPPAALSEAFSSNAQLAEFPRITSMCSDGRTCVASSPPELFVPANRHDSLMDTTSPSDRRVTRTASRSLVISRSPNSRLSADNVAGWDSIGASVRSTLMYGANMQGSGSTSPISTLSRNRISIVSSSCSTIVSDSSVRHRLKLRRPVVLNNGELPPVEQQKEGFIQRAPIPTVFEEPFTLLPLARLVSPLAPPEVTLAMAEISA